MIRIKSVRRGLGLALAVTLALSSSSALAAPSVDGKTFNVCGKWVLKLRDFGKLKVRDYADLVQIESYQPEESPFADPFTRPYAIFEFGLLLEGFVRIEVHYPDLVGDELTSTLVGPYEQKGKTIKMELGDGAPFGTVALSRLFKDLSELTLFGQRDLLSLVEFVSVQQKPALKFKARLKRGGTRLKVKLKATMQYDMDADELQTDEVEGKFKWRLDSKDCPEVEDPD